MLQSALWGFWDMIDISENMHRMDKTLSRTRNGLPSLIAGGMFLLMTIAAAAATWYFDIESTVKGMSSFTDLVVPSLPLQSAQLTWWVIAAFTVLPTLLELFTSGLAKDDVKIIQLGIIAFTIFDMVTDIPRAYAFSLQLWPQIQLMGWGVGWITFYFYFFLILFFATIGFEVFMCVFGYMTVCYAFKIFNGEGSYDFPIHRRHSTMNVKSGKSDGPIIIEG